MNRRKGSDEFHHVLPDVLCVVRSCGSGPAALLVEVEVHRGRLTVVAHAPVHNTGRPRMNAE